MRMLLKLAAVTLVVGSLGSALSEHLIGERVEARTSAWADGTPKESAVFRGDLRHGPCERFHPDGRPRARGTFHDGRMVGEWHFFQPDGTRDEARSGHYEDGTRVAPLGADQPEAEPRGSSTSPAASPSSSA